MTQDEFDAIADEFCVEHPFELGKRYGLTKDELLAHMKVHNDRIFNEWVTDYAKRVGRPVSEVRAEVIRQRQLTAAHCNEVYRREVGITKSKEDEMAKKAAAQTTINLNEEGTNMNEQTTDTVNTNEQEGTTMTENTTIEGVAFGTRKNGNWYHLRNIDIERHESIRKATKFGRIKGTEPMTCIPNETIRNITTDEEEIALLGKACAKFGWKNGVCTPSKANANHGRPNPEYKGHGWLVWAEQRYYKTGERAGQPIERGCTIAYPMEAFIWDTESGMPEFDTEKALKKAAAEAQRKLKKAKDEAKAADDAAGIKRTTRRRKTSRKAKTETIKDQPIAAASPDVITELQRSNEELRAMNAELLKRFDALSAFMIANQ